MAVFSSQKNQNIFKIRFSSGLGYQKVEVKKLLDMFSMFYFEKWWEKEKRKLKVIFIQFNIKMARDKAPGLL